MTVQNGPSREDPQNMIPSGGSLLREFFRTLVGTLNDPSWLPWLRLNITMTLSVGLYELVRLTS